VLYAQPRREGKSAAFQPSNQELQHESFTFGEAHLPELQGDPP
jgi:hypothetical protein